MENIFKLDEIGYKYEGADKYVFDKIDHDFEAGKIYAIIGHSGSGKTTLLSLMAGLDNATNGQIIYNGKDIRKINKDEYRSKYVGVIFQAFNLLPHLTAAENIKLSMDIAGVKVKDSDAYIKDLLKKVNISEDKADRRVLKLSGGEQQRVAIARTLSFNPKVILADEPTGNLDKINEDEVMKLFKSLADEGRCVIIVTHSEEVAKKADAIYNLVKREKITNVIY